MPTNVDVQFKKPNYKTRWLYNILIVHEVVVYDTNKHMCVHYYFQY